MVSTRGSSENMKPQRTPKEEAINILHFPPLFFFLAAPHNMWIVVPQPGMEPIPPALEVWSLNHQTTREVLTLPFTKVSLAQKTEADS